MADGDTVLLRARRFRALHDQPGIFVAGNPWDTGTARILAKLGFAALATRIVSGESFRLHGGPRRRI